MISVPGSTSGIPNAGSPVRALVMVALKEEHTVSPEALAAPNARARAAKRSESWKGVFMAFSLAEACRGPRRPRRRRSRRIGRKAGREWGRVHRHWDREG